MTGRNHLFVALLFCCQIIVAQNNSFDLQGHRGARGLAPENTIPSMLKALEFGVTTLELDVVITKDLKVVLSHEPWMSHEICNNEEGGEMSAEEGKVNMIFQMTYAEIKQFDCGSKQHHRFPEQQNQTAIKPLLKDVVAATETWCNKNQQPLPEFNIETKCTPAGDQTAHPPPDQFAMRLYEEIYQLGIADRTTIQSFDVRTLKEMRNLDSDIRLVLLVENDKGVEWNIRHLGFLPTIYSPFYELVDKKLIEYCHDKGMKIIPWTVNNPKHMKKLIKKSVDGLITDYPDRGRLMVDKMFN